MKLKQTNRLFMPVLLLLLLAGCKKNEAPSIANDAMRTEVTTWLDKQQTPDQDKRTAIVKGIKYNLQWDRGWEAKLGDDETMVMIPIGKGYTFMNNKDKNVDNHLVLFKNNIGEIRSAHIFQSLQGSTFTSNTIPGYYSSQPMDMNGTYWVLALHDIIYDELKYENNQLKERGMPQTKTPINNRSGSEIACIDWYWVHTTYDTETGWILSQTETYLGTTCTGCLPNTNQPQTTITAETEWDCMAGTAGSNDDGIEAITHHNWKVFNMPGANPNGFDGIRSLEYFKGKRVSSEPQGGHFKWIRHGSSSCSFCSYDISPYDIWVEEAAEVKLVNPQLTTSKIVGHLNYNQERYSINESMPFSFSSIFQ